MGASESVEASVRTGDGFYGFDPGVAQAANVGLFRMRWVLKTHDLTTSDACAALPMVTPPISGICYAMIIDDTPVHSSADASSSVLVTLHSGDYAMARAHAGNWYVVDLNVGTADKDSLGYLNTNNLGGLNGHCSSL